MSESYSSVLGFAYILDPKKTQKLISESKSSILRMRFEDSSESNKEFKFLQ